MCEPLCATSGSTAIFDAGGCIGFLEAVAARLQGTFDLDAASGFVRALVAAVPFVIEALPYILVVLLLAGFVGTAVAPRASGLPYVKEGG